ncbi:sigma-70 family RNA polymerase sigma factor [Kitasatospora sp. DSM 101779]|uniref:sigma-70 family RNA polymerase sigma factor n=1 Tax=Kitasatospora sp. DSM 101779 TaxID=2853165 RepID=UPI0021D903C0|nr:sigma-70 family RNA polymerase sigma factor [Kitasatospora sp. DSM 101779]MCU7820992.1 sigma-70 family RNA polymerase sigma factor [Kitasatospora sp. DSM 101779]
MSVSATARQTTLGHLSDAELAALLRGGDPHTGSAAQDVMSEVFARHHAAVLAYARTCCRDTATAHDLAAEAFARTCRAVTTGGGPQHAWRPYLLTCVRHVAIEWARDRARTLLSDDFEAWAESLPCGQDTDGAVLAAEERSLVLQAYRSLPERWQAVLWHAVVEHEPAAATANRLGLTVSGIGSLVARACEGLREAYLRAHLNHAASDECRHYGAVLAASIRRPDKRSTRHLERHLRSCADCARAERDLRDINGRLGAILPAGILLWHPTGLWSSVTTHGLHLAAAKLTAVSRSAAAKWTLAATAVAGAAATVAVLMPGSGGAPVRTTPAAPGAAPAIPEPTPPMAPVAAVGIAESFRPEPATATGTPTRTAAPSASAPPPGSRAFVNRMTGLCAQADPGGALTQRPCNRTAGQAWILIPTGTGSQIKNVGTGRCLATGGSTTDGEPLVQQACASERNDMVWKFCGDLVINAASSLVLGLEHWPEAEHPGPGDRLTQSPNYYNSPAFRWQQRSLGA